MDQHYNKLFGHTPPRATVAALLFPKKRRKAKNVEKLSTLGVGTTFEVPVKSAYRSFLGDYVVFKMADKTIRAIRPELLP